MDWLEGRGISGETATHYGVHSRGDALVWPYQEHGEAVNEKVRRAQKQFHQKTGGRKTFWNSDVLDDPALADGTAKLVVTEGEMDALTAIECGWPMAVSVPDGAPATPTDSEQKFEYVTNNWQRLEPVKAIIIATDADEPGGYLAEELARRFGVDRCYSVAYPDGCKDLNEVLCQYGSAEVSKVLGGAKPYPVKGLYRLSDFPKSAPLTTYSPGWPELSDHLRVVPGTLTVVTGIPAHGKSTWTSALAMNVCQQHDWTALMASFEVPPVPYHAKQLIQYRQGQVARQGGAESPEDAEKWVDERILFLAQNPADEEQEFTLEDVIEKAEIAVVRHGIRLFVLDPWNQIEHSRRGNETETEYTARALRAFRRFAQRFRVAVFVVAHPMKMATKGEAPKPPTLYDISGSAHWYNAPDFGVTIWRPDLTKPDLDVMVRKVRFPDTGKPGVVPMFYSQSTGQYMVANDREAAE